MDEREEVLLRGRLLFLAGAAVPRFMDGIAAAAAAATPVSMLFAPFERPVFGLESIKI